MAAGESGARSGSARWADSRAGRLVAFVAIAWSIAGGFLLLEEGLPELFDSVSRRGWIPDKLVMMRPAPTSDCGSAIRRAQSFAIDPRVAAQARFLIWRLGLESGSAAGFASATIGSSTRGDSSALAQPRRLAEKLGVDAPTLPAFQHAATTLEEFQAFVAQGAGCVTAQVGAKYSPRDAALLRFGLVVGFAVVYRTKVPSLEPLFVPEVRMYGAEAAIPIELRQPFIDNTLDSLPGSSPEEKVLFAVRRLSDYVGANP